MPARCLVRRIYLRGAVTRVWGTTSATVPAHSRIEVGAGYNGCSSGLGGVAEDGLVGICRAVWSCCSQ
jgi:hypothetical protein